MKKRSNIFLPDRLLISKQDVIEICENYIKKERVVTLMGSIIGAWVSMILTIITEGKTIIENKLFKYSFIIITLICMGLIAFYFIKMNKRDLLEEIQDNVIEKSDHTAIFLISKVHIDKNGKKDVELLTENHGKKEKFLVYLPIEDKVKIDEKALCKNLANKLGIGYEHLDIDLISSDHHYIKRTSMRGQEKLIRYEYYSTKINIALENSISRDLQWVYFDELRSDANSQMYNHDVIEYIYQHLLNNIQDSFIRFYEEERIKIIWNITKKCAYNCQICATNSIRDELTKSQKAQALLSILTWPKEKIKELDFSGGDPLYDDDCRDIINYAINELKKEKVYVTTTAKGVEKIENSAGDLAKYLYNCEFTIEDNTGKNRRNEKEYGLKNEIIIEKYKDYIHNLTINVPIISPDMPDNEIKSLVAKIANIPVYKKRVLLIRLMNVGKMTKNYPDKYDPIHFIEVFKKYANEYKIQCDLQCALRGKYKNEFCNMYTEKIGIDCQGNVFACAWGGYINEDVENNPFYLGNLLEMDLYEIMRGTKAIKIKQLIDRNPTTACRVFCKGYLADMDPLHKR